MLGQVIGDILQLVKHNELERAQRLLEEHIKDCYDEEVQGRRAKISAINRSIVQVDIEVKQIEIQYQLLQQRVPGTMLQVIDRYIYDLKKKRTELEILKKREALLKK
ncbi:hypothetical protein [Ectobacillus ponti]|uniref:Uncharacterized protein n=1 Tax=Ectobacillus ponti TaxID=2961894 RepID=A0AA41XDL3_9BACI|nr:hypothetical protein [Ectobacillus ponti]MCP8970950.1 hypothetical protein [Ectobacillus ponti]